MGNCCFDGAEKALTVTVKCYGTIIIELPSLSIVWMELNICFLSSFAIHRQSVESLLHFCFVFGSKRRDTEARIFAFSLPLHLLLPRDWELYQFVPLYIKLGSLRRRSRFIGEFDGKKNMEFRTALGAHNRKFITFHDFCETSPDWCVCFIIFFGSHNGVDNGSG